MERFEYGQEKQKYERLKEKALNMGLKQYQIDRTLIPEDFGAEINNNFPELTAEEEQLIEELYRDRDKVMDDRDGVKAVLKPLMAQEMQLSIEIDGINRRICGLQGHRLAEESLHLTGAYSYGYLCLVCRQFINDGAISNKDVLVDGASAPKRLSYKK